MYNYEDLKKIFIEKDCILLSTKEELEKQQKVPKVIFTASCGHENIVFVNVFISRNTGVICKNCLYERSRKHVVQLNLIKREIDFTIEFQKFILNSFQSKTTNEGCKSDLIVKPVNVMEDSWLRVQMKTTEKAYNKSYGFHINNKYEHHIMICHCIQDDKFWLIPFDELELTNNKLNLTLSEKSKYYKYYIEKENIINSLVKYYQEIELYDENSCMIPESEVSKKEYIYNQKIYDNLPFLRLERPTYTNMVYDLLINNRKVQQKLLNLQKNKNGYLGTLFKGFGKKKKQLYIYQDNDFYWLHIPDTEYFYVIPQFELLDRDIISFFETEGRKSVYLHTEDNNYKHSWANDYLFNYKNVDEGKLLKILETDYREIEHSIMYIKLMEM